MEYLSKSYRLDEEVVAELQRLSSVHGSVNKALREALLQTSSLREHPKPWPTATGAAIAANEVALSDYSDPRDIPGVSVGVPKKEATGFRCRCIHTGCRGSWFTGAVRTSNLCSDCVEKGHVGDPRNCGECFNDMGPA